MSVTGFSYNINATKKLNDLEINEGFEGNRSWHHQFRDSAYIYVGGLDVRLTEGDVVIMFSQFGEIVDVNMVRDKTTGKPKGFCFVCFEDQRSTILAVDNMNGFRLLGRTLRVDHVAKYKAPKLLDEDDVDENGDPKLLEYKATGAEGGGQGVYNVVDGQRQIAEIESNRRKPAATEKKPEDEDEAWARAFEESLKVSGDGEAEKAKKVLKKLKTQKEEIRKMKEQAKRLKAETKKAKKEAKKAKKPKKEKGQTKVKKEENVKKEIKRESSSESRSESSDDSG